MLNKYLMIIAFLIGLLLVILSDTPLAIPDGKTALESFLSVVLFSIGCSIIAATIFAYLYQSKIESYVANQMSDDIAQFIDEGMTTHFDRERKNNIELSPRYSFPASDAPIKKYNDIYDQSFKKTNNLLYRGDKILYIAYRLQSSLGYSNPAFSIQILLPNPKRNEYFLSRASTLSHSIRYKGKGLKEIAKELKVDLMAGLVAFYDLKDYVNFSIYFYDELPFFRYEILDDMLVVSVLPMQEHGYYPPTLIYDRRSLFFNSFMTNFNQAKRICQSTENFIGNDISEEYIKKLSSQSGINISLDELRKVYKAYFDRVKNG